MRILLIMPNTAIYPVGIAYIGSALKKAGHTVDGLAFDGYESLASKLSEGYDFLATGGLSVEYAKIKLISNITKQSNTKLIVGGGIVTSEPELMSRALNVDFSIMGEGEESVVELLSCFENKGDLSKVKGICYFEKGKFIKTENRKGVEDLDSLPWPDHDNFDFDRHLDTLLPTSQYYYDLFDYPREYPLVASRSCPFLCTFCWHPSGNKYRQRSLDSIMEELKERIPKYRINIVSVYDELFSHNQERVFEFSRRLKEYTDTLPWKVKWNCQMRVNNIDDKLLKIMKDSGCYMVSYGFESYSLAVLKSMKKHIKPEQIHDAIHMTLDNGISIQANFIFGDVAETVGTAVETLNFWKEHPEAGIQLVSILACPDSKLYQYCVSKGIIKDKLHFLEYDNYKIFNMTNMTNKEFSKLQALLNVYSVKYSSYATPIEIGSATVRIQCPHCREIVDYGNYKISGWRYKHKMYCRNCRKRFYAVNAFYKYYARYSWVIVLSDIVGSKIFNLTTYLRNKLKSFSIIWRIYNIYKKIAGPKNEPRVAPNESC